MPVPSYRVPVRVARGTLAALTAGLSALEEGELCYATDEDALYVIEGGVLTQATATGDLIDDTTPQLGGALDTNNFEIISTSAGNIKIAPDTTGVLEIRGNIGNDAAIQLNCETNGHGVKIKSPPHSASATYTLVLPENTGTTGQALTTDGSGVLSWSTPSTVGSIADLTDVSSTAATDGQFLVWDNTASEWTPTTSSGGGGATALDGLTDVNASSPTDGQVLSWDNTASEWVASTSAGGAGATTLSSLNDVTTDAPSVGEILYKDNDEHEYLSLSDLMAGRETVTSAVSATLTTDTGLAGINGFYADNTALTNDGFTYIVGSLDADDSVVLVPTTTGAWDSDYDSINYAGQVISGPAALKINTNGTVYLDSGNNGYNARSGNFGTDHPNADLCVSWMSQDTETRRAGYKRLTQDGTTWFVVRVDFKIPYSSGSEGMPVEVWFGLDGRIRQYFGSFIGTTSTMVVGSTRQGISNTGTILTSVTGNSADGGEMIAYGAPIPVLGFDGAKLEDLSDVGTPANDYILIYDSTTTSWVPEPIAPVATTNQYSDLSNKPTVPASIDDLTDVDTTTTPPVNGDSLVWDNTLSTWMPSAVSGSGGGGGAVSSVNGDTGAVSLGIEDMDDFALSSVSSFTTYEYSNFTGTSAGTMTSDGDWAVFTGGGPGSILTVYFRKVDSNGDEIELDLGFPASTGNFGDPVELYASHDALTWFRINESAVQTSGTDAWAMNLDATAQASMVGSGTLYLTFTDPNSTEPLANNDVLQYNSTDSKFKPVQLPTVIDKATLKAEVAASTSFSDFQTRMAAL